MGIVVDTNFFINVENQRIDLNKLTEFRGYGDVFIAAITVSELLVGVKMVKTTAISIKRSAFVEGIISHMPVLDFNEEVARSYAELHAYFLKPRNKLTSNVHDLQIAATALSYDYSVLTSNIEDFKKIPALKILVP